jgi:hypothetical protein
MTHRFSPFFAHIQRSLLASLLFTVTAVMAAPDDSDHRLPPEGVFAISNGSQCLDVQEAQLRTNGALVQTWQCDGRFSQSWRVEKGHIVNLATGRCLDVNGTEVGRNGARLQVFDCHAGANQSWRIERGLVITLADDRCLDLNAAALDRNAARVQTWTCHGGKNQRWRMGPLGVREPVAHDVEAGPLWNNNDANAKCPAVCAPGTWNKQWRTTVQGRMSVCGCLSQAAIGAPEVVPGVWPSSKQAMGDGLFRELIKAISAEGFSAGQISVIEGAARDNYFVIDQLRQVIQTMSFSSDKLRATEIIAPRILDRENAFSLYSAFDFDTDRDKVRTIFQRLK